MYIDRYTHSLSKYSVYSPQKKKGKKEKNKRRKTLHVVILWVEEEDFIPPRFLLQRQQ